MLKRQIPLPFFTSSDLLGTSHQNVAGDSGDEAFTAHLSEEDNSDESEEHVAALSLLSFARIAPSSSRPATEVPSLSGLDTELAGHVSVQLIKDPLVRPLHSKPQIIHWVMTVHVTLDLDSSEYLRMY